MVRPPTHKPASPDPARGCSCGMALMITCNPKYIWCDATAKTHKRSMLLPWKGLSFRAPVSNFFSNRVPVQFCSSCNWPWCCCQAAPGRAACVQPQVASPVHGSDRRSGPPGDLDDRHRLRVSPGYPWLRYPSTKTGSFWLDGSCLQALQVASSLSEAVLNPHLQVRHAHTLLQ